MSPLHCLHALTFAMLHRTKEINWGQQLVGELWLQHCVWCSGLARLFQTSFTGCSIDKSFSSTPCTPKAPSCLGITKGLILGNASLSQIPIPVSRVEYDFRNQIPRLKIMNTSTLNGVVASQSYNFSDNKSFLHNSSSQAITDEINVIWHCDHQENY